MKILIINPSWGPKVCFQRYNRCWPPLDMLNLAAILRNDGHAVALKDARADGACPGSIGGLTSGADMVVVDTSPLDRWQCPNLDLTPLLRWTRRVPPEKLVLCGAHGTLFPARLMDLTGAGMVVAGEPEVSGAALFRALERKEPLSVVPGLFRMENGELKRGCAAAPANLSAMPPPAYDLTNPSLYEYELLGSRLALIETARGCPNRCTFCLKTMYGPGLRTKPVRQVASEVELVLSLGYKCVYFIDLEFTLMRERTLELCEAFGAFDFKWCCQTRIDAVDADLLRRMRTSGCRLIHYGIESGVERTRELIGKPLSNDRIRRAIIDTREAGIAAAGFFLCGFPWETPSDWVETGRFARGLPLSYASFHKVTPYAGTALGDAFSPGPWWDRKDALVGGGPDVRRNFLKFYLRPAYLLDALRAGGNIPGAVRLFWSFLSGMLTSRIENDRCLPSKNGRLQ